MNDVEFNTLHGEKIMVPKDKIVFRPSSYGIILYEDKILLTDVKSTGKYTLPGGAMEPGETRQQALKREVWEETGTEVEVGECLSCEERNFYYDPTREAFQVFAFIFLCQPKTLELTNKNNVSDDESNKPEWVEISKLTEDSFQVFGNTILQTLRNKF
ncbi:MAG TPA: NUDIX hydrolase [Patescibacteria group bacterium]|nr:NUDIX hydrolase [Patescibacteria group bacterium]